MHKSRIADVPAHCRMSVFDVAELLRVEANFLLADLSRKPTMKGLIPPLSWIGKHACTYDRRTIEPWATEHGDALRAAAKGYRQKSAKTEEFGNAAPLQTPP